MYFACIIRATVNTSLKHNHSLYGLNQPVSPHMPYLMANPGNNYFSFLPTLVADPAISAFKIGPLASLPFFTGSYVMGGSTALWWPVDQKEIGSDQKQDNKSAINFDFDIHHDKTNLCDHC